MQSNKTNIINFFWFFFLKKKSAIFLKKLKLKPHQSDADGQILAREVVLTADDQLTANGALSPSPSTKRRLRKPKSKKKSKKEKDNVKGKNGKFYIFYFLKKKKF